MSQQFEQRDEAFEPVITGAERAMLQADTPIVTYDARRARDELDAHILFNTNEFRASRSWAAKDYSQRLVEWYAKDRRRRSTQLVFVNEEITNLPLTVAYLPCGQVLQRNGETLMKFVVLVRTLSQMERCAPMKMRDATVMLLLIKADYTRSRALAMISGSKEPDL